MNRTGLFVALSLALVIGVLFGIYPELDLKLAALFYDAAAKSFPLKLNALAAVARDGAMWIAWGLALPAIVALVVKLARPDKPLLISGRAIIFLLVTLVLSAGVLTNLTFKSYWGRPRPVVVTQFNGPEPFVPWWDPRGACGRNCSFFSGESATAFWTYAPAALTPPAWRPLAFAAATLFGVVTSGLRMAFGGHFFTDVAAAGLVTFLVIWLAYRLIYRWPSTRLSDEGIDAARQKALLLGIKPENIFIEDLREEFVRDYVFPMFRANAVYEGQYLLGTSIARPLIAKKQIEIAEKVGADAVSHGATGKGNDQVRFELGYYALKPAITIISPWREWDFRSREQLIAFAEAHQIPIAKDKRNEAPFSVDANLLHTSSEGKILEDPAQEVPDYVYSRTVDPEKAPDQATIISIDSEKRDAVAIDGKKLSPATLLTKLNELGRANGVGRLDLVENRFVGMKSRGMYETPGGTIMLSGHRAIESITLDRGAAHLKDELMPKYAELVYNGFWFAPEREMLQAAIDQSQQYVTGRVRLKLYKGNVIVIGRESKYSLYDQDLVTFEEGAVAYDHRDAAGFIKLNALRLRTLAQRKKKLGL